MALWESKCGNVCRFLHHSTASSGRQAARRCRIEPTRRRSRVTAGSRAQRVANRCKRDHDPGGQDPPECARERYVPSVCRPAPVTRPQKVGPHLLGAMVRRIAVAPRDAPLVRKAEGGVWRSSEVTTVSLLSPSSTL